MASGPGILSDLLTDQLPYASQLREQGQDVDALGVNGQEQTHPLKLLDTPISGPGTHSVLVLGGNTGAARIAEDLSQVWFELVHLIPRSVDFGLILTTVQVDIELFNGFRRTNIPLNVVQNNVGLGLTILNLPALPFSILHLDGLVLTLEATIDGQPDFDSTIDFELSLYTLTLLVEGSRVVTFPFLPERPMVERLRFLTDVMEKQIGTEQRVNLRQAPRQEFDIHVIRETPLERAEVENILFDWQARAFGVPVWYEPTKLTAAVVVDQLTITVQSTAFADYRVGGLAIIIEDENKFDSLIIQSFTATTITFTTGVQNTYAIGVKVYPLRVCVAEKTIGGTRRQSNAGEFFIRFRVNDNIVSLASTAAFSSHNSKVLLDDPNFLPDNSLQRDYIREIQTMDNETGKFSNSTPWEKGKNVTFKGWAINGSRQKLWEVRQLLHALRGRQTSFYLPTFQDELVATQQLTSGATSLQISYVGYARYAKHRSTKNIIRVTTTAGVKHIKTITNSVEAGAVENLTVGTAWSATIPVANIAKIEMLELVRLDSDEIRIDHLSAVGDAQIVVPVKTVFD